MKYKKWLIGLVIMVLVGIVGARFVRNFIFENVGLINRIIYPIGPHREVVWEKGPVEAETAPANRPPNIVFIIVDDLGANDLTYNGGGVANGTVPTPAIDSIAREGVTFSNGYAGHGTCAPSRASVLTGRFPSRIGFVTVPAPAAFLKYIAEKSQDSPHPHVYHEEREDEVPDFMDEGLPPEEITLAELLGQNGYYTALVGKWHLGDAEKLRPDAQGFRQFVMHPSGSALYLPKDDPGVVNAEVDASVSIFEFKNLDYNAASNSGERFRPKGYLTDYWAEEAATVIEHNKNRPFFLYLSFNAVHTPLQATREDYDALPHIENHTLRVYAAMIRALDRGVGRVLDALKQNGLEENTLVVFTSDNGAPSYIGLPDLNQPYRGHKTSFFEGGIHVPFFMKWPSRISKGLAYEHPVGQVDIFATAAAAMGTALPTERVIDGVDLLPFVNRTAGGPPHKMLVWDATIYQSLLAGDWKLQVIEKSHQQWLFNLAQDPSERVNLAKTHPEKLNELKSVLADFNQNERAKPLWPMLLETKKEIDPWDGTDELYLWAN
ncbi:MAG: sulfatase-like hydrolase/transferase [Deltaproteobacteria bacterium]|jgi:arylsulfatase A-like enzyme|nr:sulfatase-like hydrolase/transferase [Deltaproteobacteria bacterium]MBT4644145.1 sulfatase-like hydrolase/transferase [Deltaproteobacteria bacterium]MBT6502797.1 sulfatase-like hydrolase/transferase [Deltaproteobacteria bacterium]MBT7155356.1 sulfatase-like hydrolase/transferase [Deltaproteobacteria bacterium]